MVYYTRCYPVDDILYFSLFCAEEITCIFIWFRWSFGILLYEIATLGMRNNYLNIKIVT